jgi:hypothetical protein
MQLCKERTEKQELEKKYKEAQMMLDKSIQSNATMEEEIKLLRDFAYNVDKSSLDKHYITYMPKKNQDQNNKAIDSLILKLSQLKLPAMNPTEKIKIIDIIIEEFHEYNENYDKLRSNEQSLMNLVEQVYNELSHSGVTDQTLSNINKTLRKILYEKATAM